MIAVCPVCMKGAWLHCLPTVPDGIRDESLAVSRLSRLSELRGGVN